MGHGASSMEDLDTLVLRTAQAWQAEGQAVVLVTVARTWGSSPRPPGSFMAINMRGETVGSVSGGCIEDDLVHRIRQQGWGAVCKAGLPTVLRYGVSADEAHRFGLPCGGTIELVLEPISHDSQLADLLSRCQQRRCTERVLNLRTGKVVLNELGPAQQGEAMPRLGPNAFIHQLGPRARLIVIGAGDLSRFLCQMALSLGFEVIVCDPREERRATWDLPGVALSHDMPDDLVLRLRPDARTAVVALTHDPKLDDLALIDALQSEAFYVGAIGSRRNSSSRRERLRDHFDLPDEALATLHGPAGLYIGSKTPAEIALSIMAEIVAAKNGILRHAPPPVAMGKLLDEQRAGQDAATAPGCLV